MGSCFGSTRLPEKRNSKEESKITSWSRSEYPRRKSEMFIEPPMLSKEKSSESTLQDCDARSMDKSCEKLYTELGANLLDDVNLYNHKKNECSDSDDPILHEPKSKYEQEKKDSKENWNTPEVIKIVSKIPNIQNELMKSLTDDTVLKKLVKKQIPIKKNLLSNKVLTESMLNAEVTGKN